MAAGKPILISRRGHQRIDAAVREAERSTGLQFCVYLGPADDDTRAHAEDLFTRAGLHERPAVLLLVAPEKRRVEVVTAPDVLTRLPDEACDEVVQRMTPAFARGDFVEGLVAGIRALADRAGPGTAPAGSTDLPNVLD